MKIMERLQEQQSPNFIERGQQANSFPIYEAPNKSAKAMGCSYRTPSPRQESYFATGEELTPKLKTYLRQPLSMKTPPSSPGSVQAMPTTPMQKQASKSMFGLLTPCTPSFGDFLLRSPATFRDDESSPGQQDDVYITQDRNVSHIDNEATEKDYSDADEPLKTQYEKLQEQIRDAELAAALAEGGDNTGKRRSTRIAQKDFVKDMPVRKVTTTTATKSEKPVKRLLLATRDASPPESSLTAETVVHISLEYNPAVLTLDWQLQYPPGGSTHPSYAYPMLDPRLFFDPACVPVTDGLPTVFRVAPLVLPMGWRHVSWSGFLPIVFDPYHQAFKLTPIGPLPLTCEEVQQGGLAKYVPGGSEHPEAGMLPDVAPLSDGPDETYNFEGLDWVLPWPQSEIFHGTSTEEVDSITNNHPSPVSSAAPQSVAANASPPHYIEARDCPDNVVNMHDAWRWIAEKCDPSFTKFEPTPGKTWNGTGITVTSKKVKQPIASLLSSAIAETIASPGNFVASLLVKQNRREFCPFKSIATPVHANIALLGDTEFTLKELLCFFPAHFLWRKAGDRLFRSGLGNGDIAAMINMTRQLPGNASKKTNAISRALMYETAKDGSGETVRIVRNNDDAEIHSYTAEGWSFDVWELVDYPILALAHGLVALPEGPDAGPLTALIKYCKENGKYDIMLSNVSDMLQEVGISSLIEPGERGCPDKELLSRHSEALKQDKKRVKEGLKRAAEEFGDKRKRVKTG